MVENVKLPDTPGVMHDVGKSQGFTPISVQYGRVELSGFNELHRVPTVETHWKLSDEELGRLLMGAPLVVLLLSPRWPPSRIYVGNVPQEDHGNSIDGEPIPKKGT